MPNDFIHKPNQQRENYTLKIGAREFRGIQNINISYQNNAVPLKYCGMGDNSHILVPNGPLKGEITVDSLLIDSDVVLATLTGNRGLNGYILKRNPTGITYDNNLTFVSGYMTNFQTRCSIGEVPTMSYSLAIFGNIGKLATGDYPSLTAGVSNMGVRDLTFNIAAPGNISLGMDEFRTNRVLSYDLSITANRQVFYPIGARLPTHVDLAYPVEVSLTVQYAVNNYQFTELYSFPKNEKKRNISLLVNSFDSPNGLLYFYYTGATLVSEVFSAPVQGQITVTAVFKHYE